MGSQIYFGILWQFRLDVNGLRFTVEGLACKIYVRILSGLCGNVLGRLLQNGDTTGRPYCNKNAKAVILIHENPHEEMLRLVRLPCH